MKNKPASQRLTKGKRIPLPGRKVGPPTTRPVGGRRVGPPSIPPRNPGLPSEGTTPSPLTPKPRPVKGAAPKPKPVQKRPPLGGRYPIPKPPGGRMA